MLDPRIFLERGIDLWREMRGGRQQNELGIVFARQIGGKIDRIGAADEPATATRSRSIAFSSKSRRQT
jgi:hypothetical protein